MKTILVISHSPVFKNQLKEILTPQYQFSTKPFPFSSPPDKTIIDLIIIDCETMLPSGPDNLATLCLMLNPTPEIPTLFSSKSPGSFPLGKAAISRNTGRIQYPFSKDLVRHQVGYMLNTRGIQLSLSPSDTGATGGTMSLSTLVDSLEFDCWAMDSNLRYIFQNRHSIRKWGNVLGKQIDDLDIPVTVKTVWKDQALQCQKGRTIRSVYQTRIETKTAFIESTISPLALKGTQPGIMGVTRDITEFKTAELNLKKQKADIEEVNTALKVLLKKRDDDKTAMEEKMTSNLQTLVFPAIESMYQDASFRQKKTLDEIQNSLKNICSPFSKNLKNLNMTPSEIKVANFIIHGKTTKEIASLMGVAESTINTHRNHIRKKAGITKEKINLRAHLIALS